MIQSAQLPELSEMLEDMKAEWESLGAQAWQDEKELLADQITKAEAIQRTQDRDQRRRQLEANALILRDQIERIQLLQFAQLERQQSCAS